METVSRVSDNTAAQNSLAAQSQCASLPLSSTAQPVTLSVDAGSHLLMATAAPKSEPLPVAGSPVRVSSASTVPGSNAATPSTQNPALTASRAATSSSTNPEPKVLDKRRITDLLKEVDPLEQLDDDAEELLLQIADDFIDNVVTASCQMARHRKSSTVEVKDVQLHLERHWNLWIPGFGSDELRPYKKAATTEAHKQRMALIKKTMKKI
jgi:transcription initiation factor TFIID subunit 12